jgi:urocanate hydratase
VEPTNNAATVLPQLLERSFQADIVTDQTSAHDLMDYLSKSDRCWPARPAQQV